MFKKTHAFVRFPPSPVAGLVAHFQSCLLKSGSAGSVLEVESFSKSFGSRALSTCGQARYTNDDFLALGAHADRALRAACFRDSLRHVEQSCPPNMRWGLFLLRGILLSFEALRDGTPKMSRPHLRQRDVLVLFLVKCVVGLPLGSLTNRRFMLLVRWCGLGKC